MQSNMKSQFLIAAPMSGSGKTTVARGLMALLTAKGLKVQPFKCGPDYIDTKFHEAVTGRPSVNLDTFMASPEHVNSLFRRYGEEADVCIVEGMMGLFDGYDRDRGSSYEIARVLGIPVVLVVDAKSAAYSMAALLSGFIHFCKDVRVAGVIFNQVGSERHYQMLRQVCDDLQLTCLGYLPKSAALAQGSRYLGLDFSEKAETEQLMQLLEKNIDVQALLNIRCRSYDNKMQVLCPEDAGLRAIRPKPDGVTLVARNAESFSFFYEETLAGFGQTRFFNPETEVPDLSDVDLLYLPGGYPEKHAEALTANKLCRSAIREYAERGGRIVAECGGMMYLCEQILTDEGAFPMCGVLPYQITARQADRKLSLGYRRFVLDDTEYRGHEFHYSQFLGSVPPSVCQVYNAKGEPVDTPVFRYKNVLASYTHLAPVANTSQGGEALPLSGNRDERPLLRPLMLAGTGSDVGKSIVATALCRIFRQDGYQPAPFKAQNMALNSYVTPDGLEIGRAQAVQAEAAGIPCHTDMNPLLLKPQSDHTSQVVLHGKPIGSRDAYDFWRSPSKASAQASASQSFDFRQEVCDAFDRLAVRYNPIVMEGAGSIAEINLKDRDLVNMSMARHAQAAVILVGDIDRGGVFASVYGSIALQSPEDRKLIKGIIINKFRGDMRLFDEGRKMLEKICGVPVLGVIPYYKDIFIDEEDSVALARKKQTLEGSLVQVAVVLLGHISNYTDFNVLERDPRVNLFYTCTPSDILKADIVILPGTKSTLDDLLELRRNSCAQAIQRAHQLGKMIVGICGGYQMLGQMVEDPEGVEGSVTRLPGLGLLPVNTTMAAEKATRQVTFEFDGQMCQGYEIHQGVSTMSDSGALAETIVQAPHCLGTYIHGILDNAPVIDYLLGDTASRKDTSGGQSYADFKEEQYDKLAAHVRQYLDMDRIYDILKVQEVQEVQGV